MQRKGSSILHGVYGAVPGVRLEGASGIFALAPVTVWVTPSFIAGVEASVAHALFIQYG